MDDLRYAVRAAFRSPLAALVIIGSLALGIGASTAVFSFAAVPDRGSGRRRLPSGTVSVSARGIPG